MKMKLRSVCIFLTTLVLLTAAGPILLAAESPGSAVQPTATPCKLGDIRIRDPFILADATLQIYYLVRSMAGSATTKPGVAVFTSKNLEDWQGPTPVFEIPPDFWAQGAVWAPEMHHYNGKYYLFATFNAAVGLNDPGPRDDKGLKRGTAILVADSPLGPFKAFHNHAHTGADLLALDGTFWVEDGVPYMVYCHEWTQVKDGTVELIQLKSDLSDTIGEPVTLFKGSDAPWTPRGNPTYVTDGPFLYRSKSGKLFMIWSSFASSYTTGIAVSDSGKVRGPWRQLSKPLYEADGGHGMIFNKFDGTLMLLLHAPNHDPERAHLFQLEDTGEALEIKRENP
jgi:GH43 family beta-xylosidase